MRHLFYISTFLLSCLCVAAQDTVRHHLKPVNVTAERKPVATLTQTPTQMYETTTLEKQGVETLGEASRQMAGVTLKDYGGVGGIKTISARGLSSQYSMLTLDGIPVTDCQNGQVDLGRYPLGDADNVCFSMGQSDNPLQTARSLSAGNVMNLESHRPDSTGGRLQLEAGSFGLLSPTLTLRRTMRKGWAISLWGNYLQCRGNYPFTLYYTHSRLDSTSVERREHSAVRSATLEGNLFHRNTRSDFVLKARHYQNALQLPGAVVLYTQRGTEETTARVSLLQARYRLAISEKTHFMLCGKYSNMLDTYLDTALLGALPNRYLQQEGYLSAALSYEPLDRLTFSIASDGALSSLQSSLEHNNHVQRIASQSALSAHWRRSWIDLSANALLILSNEHSEEGLQRTYRRLSPYAGVNVRLWQSSDYGRSLRLRYFFKENYRLPNFNEVYFFAMTRVNLRPEKATQHNIGLTFNSLLSTFTLDAYYNRVCDKIVAFPAQSLFLWSMQNLGRVDIYGVDVACEGTFGQLRLHLNYSYQCALDVTDPESKTYRNQIPYTPRHSGGAALTWEASWLTLSYNAQLVGERYSLGQNALNYRLRPYVDQGVTLSYQWKSYTFRLQCLNLFNVQYEVVQCYPMMGRNYRISIHYKF